MKKALFFILVLGAFSGCAHPGFWDEGMSLAGRNCQVGEYGWWSDSPRHCGWFGTYKEGRIRYERARNHTIYSSSSGQGFGESL